MLRRKTQSFVYAAFLAAVMLAASAKQASAGYSLYYDTRTTLTLSPAAGGPADAVTLTATVEQNSQGAWTTAEYHWPYGGLWPVGTGNPGTWAPVRPGWDSVYNWTDWAWNRTGWYYWVGYDLPQSVLFYRDGIYQASVPVDASGRASCTLSTSGGQPGRRRTFTARFVGYGGLWYDWRYFVIPYSNFWHYQGGWDTFEVRLRQSEATTNHRPAANADSYDTDEDTPLTIAAPGVLANDTDGDGDALTAMLVAGPANGTLTLNADGSFTYTPNANYNGTDTFTYKADEGGLYSNTATVTITIRPVNDAPVAGDDTATTDEDTPADIKVLANDTDPEGDALAVTGVTQAQNGAVSLNTDGTVRYAPSADFNGTDSFTYTISDGNGGTATGTVTIAVAPANDAPAAEDDRYDTDEDTPLTIAAPGVLGNDADVEGDPLTAVLVTGPAHGTLTLNADGSFTYTPNADYNGTDSFTYKTNDGGLDSNTATVTITIRPVNDTPVARDDAATTDEDQPATIAVLANDGDVDGHTLTVTAITQGAHGAVAIGADGTVVYTPKENWNGQDTFAYTISDGELTATATVTVTVDAVNDPPVADASLTPVEVISPDNEGAQVALDGSLSYDVDGDALTYSWFAGGRLDTPIATGAVAAVRLPVGTHAITLVASDGQATGAATIQVVVTTAGQAADTLAAQVDALAAPHGIKNALNASLSAAAASFARGSMKAGVNQLRAFQAKVREQAGKSIAPADADRLVAAAQQIIDVVLGG